MVPAEGVRLLELACLQEALGPLLGCPCCAGQLQLREDCVQSSGLYSALCFACQACQHRLPLHTSCRASEGSGWQVNISTEQAKAQLGVGDDLLCRLFNIYRIPYHPQSDIPDSAIEDSIQSTEALLGGSIDTCRTNAILDSLLERDEPFRDFVCSLCHQSFDCLRMLKQHMNLHNIECLDNVNLMNSLHRSIDNRDDLLHVPIESIEPDTGLVFSSTDVEKSLQLSPKTQTVSGSLCDQRFQTLDILEENLDTDSIRGTFEYSENFDDSTSNLTESLNSEKEEIMQCPVESNVSSTLKVLKSPIKDSSTIHETRVHSNPAFDQALSINNEKEHKCGTLMSNTLKENQKDLKIDTVHSPIEAIVIETVLQFPTEVEAANQIVKSDHIIPTDNCSITLSGLEVLKNQTRTGSFTFLEQNPIETITSSIANTNDVKGPINATMKSKSHSDIVENHSYKTASKNNLSCTICDHVFENTDNFKKHTVQRCSRKQFKCTECSHSFTAKHELNDHCATSHVKNKYLCTICGKSYKKSSSLTQHSRKHTGALFRTTFCFYHSNKTTHLNLNYK